MIQSEGIVQSAGAPSLSIHCANINSVFGLSPNVDVKKLWDQNKN